MLCFLLHLERGYLCILASQISLDYRPPSSLTHFPLSPSFSWQQQYSTFVLEETPRPPYQDKTQRPRVSSQTLQIIYFISTSASNYRRSPTPSRAPAELKLLPNNPAPDFTVPWWRCRGSSQARLRSPICTKWWIRGTASRLSTTEHRVYALWKGALSRASSFLSLGYNGDFNATYGDTDYFKQKSVRLKVRIPQTTAKTADEGSVALIASGGDASWSLVRSLGRNPQPWERYISVEFSVGEPFTVSARQREY